MKKVVEKYAELPAIIRKPFWKIWHKLLISLDKTNEVTFMNYGFEGDIADKRPDLMEKDEVNRYCIQLYNHVVQPVKLDNLDVLEVGSGRGGGASFISRYHNPKSYTGMDISESVVKYCNKIHNQVKNLRFVRGIAEKLPFENHQYDVIVNVESARCYTSLTGFFKEVHRVLRPGGKFLFADMIKQHEVDELIPKLNACGFTTESSRNISSNIVKSLLIDHERRNSLINKRTPSFLHSSFAEFAGTKGSERFEGFSSGKMQYWSFVLCKK